VSSSTGLRSIQLLKYSGPSYRNRHGKKETERLFIRILHPRSGRRYSFWTTSKLLSQRCPQQNNQSGKRDIFFRNNQKKKNNECNRRWSHMFPHWSTSCNLNSGPLPRSPAFINSLNLDWAHVSLTMNLYIQYRIYLVGIDFKKMGCDKLPLVDVHSPSGGSGGGGLAQSPNCLFAKREIIPD